MANGGSNRERSWNATSATRHVRWMLALLAIVLSVLVAVVYIWVLEGTPIELAKNTAPSVLAALLAFLAIYFFLERGGILATVMSGTFGPLKGFHHQHKGMNWGPAIRAASEIDIVVNYYDSWVQDNHEHFVEFFRRGGRLQIVLPDPLLPDLMEALRIHFFPDRTVEGLVERVDRTVDALDAALQESASLTASIRPYYFPTLLHYACVITDRATVYLSAYDQFRRAGVRSSVFEISISNDEPLRVYWRSSLDQFKMQSRAGQMLTARIDQ